MESLLFPTLYLNAQRIKSKLFSVALTGVALFMSALLAACTSTPTQLIQKDEVLNDPVLKCQRFYYHFNAIVDTSKVRDAQTAHIENFPQLQINRFLAALKPQLNQQTKLHMWLSLLAQLGLQSNSIELKNLPPVARDQLTAYSVKTSQNADNEALLHKCSQTLLEDVMTSTAKQNQILATAEVPDNYRIWNRIVGLYPLVALPIAWGIHNWHQDSSTVLKTPTEELPITGKILRYNANNQLTYVDFEEVKSAIQASSQNPLKIPLPDSDTTERLFATFSPLWEVDTVQNSDKIGAPQWPSQSTYPSVNIEQPTVYTLLSHSILNNENLLQLNYFVWFPNRPCTSSLDYLCGKMDGLIWRVTLGADGKPLIYDTVHSCGCYHTFFPTGYLKPVPNSRCFTESDFSPIQAPETAPGTQLVVRIAHSTHYVESLTVTDNNQAYDIPLAWQDYSQLRSLPYSTGQYKSLFQENAIVAGTQRKERWFLWPLGVPSPGAMRQWGNHATAFIGRREFDDPYLFENSFALVKP